MNKDDRARETAVIRAWPTFSTESQKERCECQYFLLKAKQKDLNARIF